jgi:hypothetical protein
MIQSFSRLMTTRTGVDPDRVRTVRISLPRDAKSPVVLSFFAELEKREAALPGLESVGLMNCHALAGGCNGTLIWFS